MAFTDNTESEFNRNAGLDSNGVHTVFGKTPKGMSGKTLKSEKCLIETKRFCH